jgi:phage-related protein
MPPTQVLFYEENENAAPLVEWLNRLRQNNTKAFLKCRSAINRLAFLGHELRRPEADYLRDGIYELRIRHGSINYRLLYFFHGRAAVVLAHGLTKESTVPPMDIERAIGRRSAFFSNPDAHTFKGTIENA